MKKVVGIISIVLFFIIVFQSCAAGVGDALMETGGASGSAGMMLAFCMLIGGILALASGTKKGVLITAIIFYIVGGIIAIANIGIFADLQIWAILSFIFGGLLIFHLYKNKDMYISKK